MIRGLLRIAKKPKTRAMMNARSNAGPKPNSCAIHATGAAAANTTHAAHQPRARYVVAAGAALSQGVRKRGREGTLTANAKSTGNGDVVRKHSQMTAGSCTAVVTAIMIGRKCPR